jgi:signal transduction histidine kinase
VTAAAVDRRVLLTVSDDGPGIPAGQRARATAPGIRLDERSDGHGFGLAIVRELAELHGGMLSLDDGPDGGLLARVSLPYAG